MVYYLFRFFLGDENEPPIDSDLITFDTRFVCFVHYTALIGEIGRERRENCM